MTVSKALANHPDVAEKTREQVIHTAKEMNYRVNRIARSLVQRKTNTIGVIVPDVSELFYAEILNGIESVTRSANYSLLLANTDNDPDIERKSIQILLETRIDGLLFCPTEKNDLSAIFPKASAVPIVLFNNSSEGMSCDTVRVDRGAGAYQSVELSPPERLRGDLLLSYVRALVRKPEQRRGLHQGVSGIRTSHGAPETGALSRKETRAFPSKGRRGNRVSAERIGIFAWDDEMAVGIYRASHRKGTRHPGSGRAGRFR